MGTTIYFVSIGTSFLKKLTSSVLMMQKFLKKSFTNA